MKLRDFKTYQKSRALPDAWWVSVDDEVRPNTLTLHEIETRRRSYLRREVHLLNSAEVDDPCVDWKILEVIQLPSLAEFRAKRNIQHSTHAPSLAAASWRWNGDDYSQRHDHSQSQTLKLNADYYSKKDLQNLLLQLSNEACRLEKLKKKLVDKELYILEREKGLNDKLCELKRLSHEVS